MVKNQLSAISRAIIAKIFKAAYTSLPNTYYQISYSKLICPTVHVKWYMGRVTRNINITRKEKKNVLN